MSDYPKARARTVAHFRTLVDDYLFVHDADLAFRTAGLLGAASFVARQLWRADEAAEDGDPARAVRILREADVVAVAEASKWSEVTA
jgi:hypothetical protein